MSRVDGDAAVALLRRIVDLVVIAKLGQILGREDLGNGGGEGGLPVVHVPNCANVAVGLVPLEYFFVVQNATEQGKEKCKILCTAFGWLLTLYLYRSFLT